VLFFVFFVFIINSMFMEIYEIKEKLSRIIWSKMEKSACGTSEKLSFHNKL